MKKHIADESTLSEITNVWLPFFLGLLIFSMSAYGDLTSTIPTSNWTQRSGNFLIVIGAYIGYHKEKQSLKIIDGNLYLNPELRYTALAFIYAVIGTIISGYGDFIIRWFK